MWPSLAHYGWGALHPFFLLGGACGIAISAGLLWSVARWRGVAALGVGFFVGTYFDRLIFQLVYGGQQGLGGLLRITPLSALQSGGTVLGLIFGGLLGASVVSGVLRVPTPTVADAACVGLSFGTSIGKLGCFANGCCFGLPTELPWGVHFSTRSAAGLVSWPMALHPVQLYESGLCLLLGVLLSFLRARRTPWQLTGTYLTIYGAGRFGLQFLRVDSPVVDGRLTRPFWMALLLLLGGLCAMFAAWWKGPDPATPPGPSLT